MIIHLQSRQVSGFTVCGKLIKSTDVKNRSMVKPDDKICPKCAKQKPVQLSLGLRAEV